MSNSIPPPPGTGAIPDTGMLVCNGQSGLAVIASTDGETILTAPFPCPDMRPQADTAVTALGWQIADPPEPYLRAGFMTHAFPVRVIPVVRAAAAP